MILSGECIAFPFAVLFFGGGNIGSVEMSIPKIGLQKIEINCNPNLVQNDNKT